MNLAALLAIVVVSIAPSLQQQLAEAASGTTEHVWCLTGMLASSGYHLTSGYELPSLPTTVAGQPGVVASDTCGPVLAVWHNHPIAAGESARDVLYFTKTDQHTFIWYELAPIAIVGAGDKWCYWTRDQVLQGWKDNLSPLPAVPEQCV